MFKIAFIGQPRTGKRTILKNINSPHMQIEYSSSMLGVDFNQMLFDHHGISTKLGIWSINGNPRYRQLYPQYLRGIKAAIVVFDVTNRQSFQNIEYWIGLTRNNQIQRPIGFLVGNKIDSTQRAISFEEGKMLADNWGFIYMEVSALSKESVRGLFQTIIIFVANGLSV